MRVVFNYIENVYDNDVNETVNLKYPPKPRSVKDIPYSLARTKFLKSRNKSASNRLNKMCNKILAFLKDIKGNTIVYNQEFRMLQSIVDSDRKETVEAWISSLPSDEWFQELLKPEALATEKVFLETIYDRNSMKSVSDQVIRAVKDLSVSNVVDLTVDDVDVVVNRYPRQRNQKPLSSIQKQKMIDLVAVYKLEMIDLVPPAESTSGAVSSVQSHSTAESMIVDDEVVYTNAEEEEEKPMNAVSFLHCHPPAVKLKESHIMEKLDLFLSEIVDLKLSSKDILSVGKRILNALEVKSTRRNMLFLRSQLLHPMIKERVISSVEGKELVSTEPVSTDEQQLVTVVDRNAGAEVSVLAAAEEAESMIVDDEKPVSTDEQQFVSVVGRDSRSVADVNAVTEEVGSVSSVKSVQNHSLAVQRTTYLDFPIMLRILNFVHPYLHHIVCKTISMTLDPVDCTCKDGANCTCRHLLTKMPPKLQYSLYVRASLYTDTIVSDTPGYPWINKSVWTAIVEDNVWCMVHFRECSDSLLKLVERSIYFPTCREAYQRSRSKNLSPLWLHWARKNHCSCIYDLKSIRPLSLNEKDFLKWLEIHARAFQRGSHFQHYYDTPIRYGRGGDCLWSTFMSDSARVEPKELIDEDDIVDKSLILWEITDAASAEINDCSKLFKKYLVEQLSVHPNRPSIATPSATRSQSIWDYSDTFNKIVNSTEVCIVNVKGYRPELSAALTVFAHAIRMEILQNSDLGICDDWRGFINEVYGGERNWSDADANNDIFQIMRKCKPNSRLLRDTLFDLIAEFQIVISLHDDTASLASKLCTALSFNVVTGLYLCRVEHEDVGTTKRADLFVPLLIRKPGKCYQIVACIYRTANGDISYQVITRSLQGLLDDQYIACHCTWKPKKQEWSKTSPAKVREDGKQFNTVLHLYKLYGIVLIPTATQRIPSTASNFSMKFFNEEEERISERWTVRDQLSLGGTSCHLTESVLRKLVLDLMNKYRESKQSIIVSATFIDELRSFMEFGNADMSTNSFPPMSDQLVRFAEEFLFQEKGVIHLFFSYKQIDGSNYWVYSYFILEKKTLVVLSRRSDPVREILAIVSSIKQFLQVAIKATIIVKHILWRNNDLCHGNSGYYALKQFWKNAANIKHHISNEYLHMIQKLKSVDEQRDRNHLMMKPITQAQLKELKKNYSNVLSRSSYYYSPNFLLND